jgi:hypothetical protein
LLSTPFVFSISRLDDLHVTFKIKMRIHEASLDSLAFNQWTNISKLIILNWYGNY